MNAMGDCISCRNIPEELYSRIRRIMPLVCVDLVVVNGEGQLLMVRRKNEPAMGEWWFPGGRVLFGEARIDAARRKLREECGLAAERLQELFTADCILHFAEESSHAVTTFYRADIRDPLVSLDDQSVEYSWKTLEDWKGILSGKRVWPFISRIFAAG